MENFGVYDEAGKKFFLSFQTKKNENCVTS